MSTTTEEREAEAVIAMAKATQAPQRVKPERKGLTREEREEIGSALAQGLTVPLGTHERLCNDLDQKDREIDGLRAMRIVDDGAFAELMRQRMRARAWAKAWKMGAKENRRLSDVHAIERDDVADQLDEARAEASRLQHLVNLFVEATVGEHCTWNHGPGCKPCDARRALNALSALDAPSGVADEHAEELLTRDAPGGEGAEA